LLALLLQLLTQLLQPLLLLGELRVWVVLLLLLMVGLVHCKVHKRGSHPSISIPSMSCFTVWKKSFFTCARMQQ
jgi:hypothetical protein